MGDFSDMFGSEIVSTTGGIMAGVGLSFLKHDFSILPGLFILLPGLLELRGNISGSLSARMGSALHMGKIKPQLKMNSFIWSNIIVALLLTIFSTALVGTFAAAVNHAVFGGAFDYKLISVAVIAGLISQSVQMPFVIFMELWLFSKNHDPDDIMGPVLTTTSDMISVVAIFVAVMLVA